MKRNKLVYIFLLFLSITLCVQSCQNESSINYKRYYVNGKGLYEKHCQSCHGTDGEGLGTLYPPLTDSNYLKLNRSKLACIIKNGQNEEIRINKIVYQGQMPGNNSLPDIDVAQIIVYISNSFGNQMGYYDQAQVVKDLEICK